MARGSVGRALGSKHVVEEPSLELAGERRVDSTYRCDDRNPRRVVVQLDELACQQALECGGRFGVSSCCVQLACDEEMPEHSIFRVVQVDQRPGGVEADGA